MPRVTSKDPLESRSLCAELWATVDKAGTFNYCLECSSTQLWIKHKSGQGYTVLDPNKLEREIRIVDESGQGQLHLEYIIRRSEYRSVCMYLWYCDLLTPIGD